MPQRGTDHAPTPPTAAGAVVVIPREPGRDRQRHEWVTLEHMARRIAALLGYRYVGEDVEAARASGRLYAVPEDTLLAEDAQRLGIHGSDDLFGGVVPHDFLTTKTISHPALSAARPVPDGWRHALAGHLDGAVLPGFSVFCADDAREACARLLPGGPVRVKQARGIGGSGQSVVDALDGLDAALAQLPPDELEQHGVTLEQHLEDAVTFSVGQVELGGERITYCGTQRLVENHEGEQVYGGSDLHVVRGGFDALLALPVDEDMRRALRQACQYDEAFTGRIGGFFASRRNYDVVQGRDRSGQLRSGVLEQSWRIGGASPAEIRALEAFAADPSLREVRASSHEVYALVDPPPQTRVHYRDVDPCVGAITKYSRVDVPEEARDGRPA